MNNVQNQVIEHVMTQISGDTAVDEGRLDVIIKACAVMVESLSGVKLSSQEVTEIRNELHNRLKIRMKTGTKLVNDHTYKAWYPDERKRGDRRYWNRYSKYMSVKMGFNKNVIDALDANTDEIMDLIGNPKIEGAFSRRGLIIGDVQSGKTATYISLLNKAADAGYHVIILLTGMIEKLRRQTQDRVDNGFSGLASKEFTKDKQSNFVGVGLIDEQISAWAITSTTGDFNKATANKVIGKLDAVNVPVIFVLKKNKSVLEKLEQWLIGFNANKATNVIDDIPMLMIDDEADNASVNTHKPDEDPTAINSCIRRLLKLFTKSSYVAFTATPYANIFIDPDSTDEMRADDLFPRDFIYALEAPSNYVGARNMYTKEGKYSYMLKDNADCENYLPIKHKKGEIPGALPQSLKEAIASFFIANAIRDLRGHNHTHRTMLINISRFIDVQKHICDQVSEYVWDVRRTVELYGSKGQEALEKPDIAFIKAVYEKHLVNLTDVQMNGERRFSWEQIQAVLYRAIAPIEVRTIHGGNAPKNLNYEQYEDGLRLIAVGGLSLSRGLTLEGLCTSYFYRNSKMYDTLMQMGRWFGYRDHYADLCQVWMSKESVQWYAHISKASDELRGKVKKMQDAGATPDEFGLGVRSDNDALIVTALNKMRSASDYERLMYLDGSMVETPYVSLKKDDIEWNLSLLKRWTQKLIDQHYEWEDEKDTVLARRTPQIFGVSKSLIVEFLNQFRVHRLNLRFPKEELLDLIVKDESKNLDEWDVAIINGGARRSENFGGRDIQLVRRAFAIKIPSQGYPAVQMSGKRARLGDVGSAQCGLTKEQKRRIEEEIISEHDIGEISNEKKISFKNADYFSSSVKRRPLLAIFPIRPDEQQGDRLTLEEERYGGIAKDNTFIGISIGIPQTGGKSPIFVKYKVNRVWIREQQELDDEEPSEETEE